MVKNKVVRRRIDKFDVQQAFEEPMQNLKTTQDRLPLPHLETFLDEVNKLDSSLIDHIFVLQLFSVSEENIMPNDSQVIYAKMLAYGFVKAPHNFANKVTVVYNSSKRPLLLFSASMTDLYHVSSPIAQSMMLFGVDADMGAKLSKLYITPNSMLIRLIQLNIIKEETLDRYSYMRNSVSGNQRTLSMINNLELYNVTLKLESELIELADNTELLMMMLISPEAELVIPALKAGIKFIEVLTTMKLIDSTPEQAIKVRLYGVDYSILSALHDLD